MIACAPWWAPDESCFEEKASTHDHLCPYRIALATDLLTGAEWGSARVRELFHLAADIKARPAHYRGALGGRFLALILEKPSLRTRVTFEVGIQSMGGAAVFLDHTASRLGERESIPDVARNLSRWVQGIVARVYEQHELEQLAEYANIPVINALSGPLPSLPGVCGFLHSRRALRRARAG